VSPRGMPIGAFNEQTDDRHELCCPKHAVTQRLTSPSRKALATCAKTTETKDSGARHTPPRGAAALRSVAKASRYTPLGPSDRTNMRIALVSCVKSKRSTPAPAKDLYTSPLFCGLRKYAESNADVWYILSAEHGLLSPDQVIAPYERTLNTMGKVARQRWAADVQAQLIATLPHKAEVIILAGERYRKDLVPFLRERGHAVDIPLEGLSFGRQLQRLGELSLLHPSSTADESTYFVASTALPQPREFTSGEITIMREPVLAALTSRNAVLEAINEFDQLGRDAFLKKYGYGKSQRYYLEFNSRQYDSKAIVGAAYGRQFPDRGPLQNTQFSGGESTVQRKLEELGFNMSVLPS